MSTFAEFCLVALALYLWESALWLPLRGVVLRKVLRGRSWRVLEPDRWLALRETGMVPLFPLIGSGRIAPCQAPPLLVDPGGRWLLETSGGRWVSIKPPAWEDIRPDHHHLVVGKPATRLSSPRVLAVLSRARQRGLSPADAVRRAWRMALSPVRAGREWARWRTVSAPLGWLCPLLTVGFFGGLPYFYLYLGGLRTLCFAGWLWAVMLFIAGHVWWLGRVYPAAKAAVRMDALLAALVPFHAMRAREIVSAHAMGATHPAALVLSTEDRRNPWLVRWIRVLCHPRPGVPADTVLSAALLPVLSSVLARQGSVPGDFSIPPDRRDDPNATGYCPRCHGRFLSGVTACGDCGGLPVRHFPDDGARV